MQDSDSTLPLSTEVAASFEPDAVLLGAAPLARAALLEITPASTVGEVVGHDVHSEHVLSLHFASLMPGYPDWHWTATLSRIDENSEPNVLETGLLPGDSAVLSPDWTPWSDRLEDYKLAQDDDADDDESDDDDDDDDDDESDDELDLDDHILDDDVLDVDVLDVAVLDASVIVRADADEEFARDAADDSHEIDPHEEGLTVVSVDDTRPRASVYFDEDAPRDDE